MPAPFPVFTASYWQVEHALVHAFSIARTDEPAFRSRLGALQKGGLFGAKHRPGKGAKLVYTPDQFHRLVFALELASAGAAPGIILRVVRDCWDNRLCAIFTAAERAIVHAIDDIVMLVVPNLVAQAALTIESIDHVPLRELPARMERALRDRELPARVLTINLSARLRLFHESLADVHMLQKARKKAARSRGVRRGEQQIER